jgi:hypothetical protein
MKNLPSVAQLNTMLEMQASINSKIRKTWLEDNLPYLRAAMLEAAEAIEHHGWKWWKAQEKDLPQLQMELVDIWHFAMSHLLLLSSGHIERAGIAIFGELKDLKNEGSRNVVFDQKTYDLKQMDTVAKLELMIGLCSINRFSVVLFHALLEDCEMDWHILYRQFVSKQVLNFFRQDHGYQDGTYVKIWNGREDNDHLIQAMDELDIESPSFRDDVYTKLESAYAKHKDAK